MSTLSKAPLTWWLTAPEEEIFAKYPKENYYEVPDKPDLRFLYFNNDSDVLLVAHLDTVQTPEVGLICPEFIAATGLDDRLGAYLIMEELVRKRSIKADVLLTTNEEKGRSTAANFVPPDGKSYNWSASFDRRGTDVVLYKYNYDTAWRKAIEAVEPKRKIEHGSYSCVQSLTVGCCGMNIGCGYYDNHSKDAYAMIDEIKLSLEFFLAFYEANKATKFAYEEKKFIPYTHHTPRHNNYYPGYGHYGSGSYEPSKPSNTPIDITTLKGTYSLRDLSKRATKRCKRYRRKHGLCEHCGYPPIGQYGHIDKETGICSSCERTVPKCDMCKVLLLGTVVWVGTYRYCAECFTEEQDKKVQRYKEGIKSPSHVESESKQTSLVVLPDTLPVKSLPYKGKLINWYCDCGNENSSPKAALRWTCSECGLDFKDLEICAG